MAIINPIWAYWIVNQRSPGDDQKDCILGYTMEFGIPQGGCSTCPEDRPDHENLQYPSAFEGDGAGSPLAFDVVANCLWSRGMVSRLISSGVALSVPRDSNGVLIDGILQATSYNVGFCVERYWSRPFRERSCM